MSGTQVREALARGRGAVADALALGATTGPEPDEETLSWLLQSTTAWASDRIVIRPFTRREESRDTGADWLWWWEGDPDQWFGCLVQAKRLRLSAGSATFDYSYRPAPSGAEPDPPTQLQRLLDASDRLGVPAAYLLYRTPALGLPDDWACQTIPSSWRSASVTFIAAAIVHERTSYGFDLDLDAVRPIDCLACDGRCGDDMARLAWYSQNLADPEVRRILRAPPTTAARRAFRALFSDVVQLRATQLRGAAPDQLDRFHSGFALGEHFSRGIRQPPWYVQATLSGEDITDLKDLPDVAGVVIVRD